MVFDNQKYLNEQSTAILERVERFSDKLYLEFGGNELYDTGLLVYKDFVDEPQPANLAPMVVLDPEPVDNPRPILNFMPWP